MWFLDRNKASSAERDRRGEILFLDARQMGTKVSRTQIELTEEELQRIVGTYHAWRDGEVGGGGDYADEPGFCKSANLADVETAGLTLSPGRYVGAPESEEDEVAFEERTANLVEQLGEAMERNRRAGERVHQALLDEGYEL